MPAQLLETRGAEPMDEVKQMPLTKFMKEYSMPRSNVDRLIHTHGFPAYKLGGRWYVDIPEFKKWRVQEHRRQFKYAK